MDLYNATLIGRMDITPQLAIFQVCADEKGISFTPGQFTVLGLRYDAQRLSGADLEEELPPGKAQRLLRRAYSITSGSQQDRYLEFYISLINSGQLTPRLFALNIGARLFMGTAPKGVFTLDQVPIEQNLLLVATGTGLAPYMSMIRTLSLGQSCSTRPIAVLHGARYSWDLGYRGELESLARHCPSFHYFPVVSRPQADPNWSGATGHLGDWLVNPTQLAEKIGFVTHPTHTHIFLCGNPDMIETTSTILTEMGFNTGTRQEPGNLHIEKY
ncbi:MAG: ferredoxin--NADP reductase [Magnetococcus sp. DMHC-6]